MKKDASSRMSTDQLKKKLNLLGMTLTEMELDSETSTKLSSQIGVVAHMVECDSDAFRAGVRSGDIIAEVNSSRIRCLRDLQEVVRLHDPHVPLMVFLMSSGGWRFTNLSFIRGGP